ncbi:MAG: AMP-binding protein [Syntrophales bacterium]|nr:AMP-binding protein [Syntrophales bacterium]
MKRELKSINYEKRTIGYVVEDTARKYGGSPFLLFRDQKISFQEVNDNANRFAQGLLKLGIKKGDKVVIIMPNCPEIIYAWFGIAKMGVVEVPLNTAHRGETLKYMINNAEAETIIIAKPFLDRIGFIEEELENIKRVVVFFPDPKDQKIETPLRFETISFNQLMDNPHDPPQVEVKFSDPLSIIYTSGTTGLSKGAVNCHNAQILYAQDLIPYMTYTADDIIYSPLPLFHVNAKYFTCLEAMMVGGRYAIGEGFSATRFWDEIRKYKATAFHFLGGIPSILYKQPAGEDDADNPVRIAWGGPIPAEIYRDFEKRFNLRFNSQYFGMTETGMVVRAPYDDPHFTSCGKHTEGYDVRLLDEEGYEAPPNEIGEICVRPLRPYSLMSGYYNRPDATLEVMRNYWFHTGDLAKRDEKGYFYFVDRKKDALRRRGENISSFEIERVILSHPAVGECAVVDVPSELGGVGEGEVKAVITLKKGASLKPDDLIAYCEPRMAYFMIPRYLDFKDSLPKTPTERVEKYKLREEGVTKNAWDREKAGYKLKR